MRNILLNIVGKPSGPGSASAFAIFHPRCRCKCKSKNVAQWSTLTVKPNENLSMN
jgi:hypothetical protein